MQISIHSYHADLLGALQAYVDRRLRFALSRFGARVGQVTVRIGKVGPARMSCRISTEIRPFGQLAVKEVDPDLFAAIDRATGRLSRVFGRELERVQNPRAGRESVRLIA